MLLFIVSRKCSHFAKIVFDNPNTCDYINKQLPYLENLINMINIHNTIVWYLCLLTHPRGGLPLNSSVFFYRTFDIFHQMIPPSRVLESYFITVSKILNTSCGKNKEIIALFEKFYRPSRRHLISYSAPKWRAPVTRDSRGHTAILKMFNNNIDNRNICQIFVKSNASGAVTVHEKHLIHRRKVWFIYQKSLRRTLTGQNSVLTAFQNPEVNRRSD